MTERYNIPEYAKEKRMNLEQAAREKRYAFFNRQIFQGVVDRVALAHHRNDQEETVLLHLLRGSGIKGLCGMQFYREPGIIRPLLDISREEIDRYVEENHIPFREDQTNQDIMPVSYTHLS